MGNQRSLKNTAGIDPPESALSRAAAAWGIEQSFYDIWGKPHQASPEVQQAILRSLGVDVSSDRSIEAALDRRVQLEASRPLPPVIVTTQAVAPLPPSAGGRVLFHWEDGTTSGEARDPLPLGYHEISVEANGQTWPRTRLIVCPDRAYQLQERTAGIGVSLYAVRSARNWGCGDFTDLQSFIDWVVEEVGASFIALNPLHAIANRAPYNTSPYLPNSVLYKNLIYLDVEKVAEFPPCGELSDAVRAEIEALRNSEFVEYERVARLKTRLLKFLFRRFMENHYGPKTPRGREFQQYIDREGDLLQRFAIHSALDEVLHKRSPDAWNWASWPGEYQNPESAETQEFARIHARSVLFYKYIQWQLEFQLANVQAHAKGKGMSIGLYHDLALATDRFGSDVWANRSFYIEGCRVGAPPDDFSPNGQDWAFPPPNSQRHYEDGYRMFAASIQKNAQHGGALRIDHVMRFFHLFWIPEGMHASGGTYVRDRARDLLHILALESVRGQFVVIGEDLGTVPDEIRSMLAEFGILSYRLLYFEKQGNGQFRVPRDYPQQALVSTTTHDLPTLAGFWAGRDIEARRSAGVLPDEESYQRMKQERLREKQVLLTQLREAGLLPPSGASGARENAELTEEIQRAVIAFLSSTPSQMFLLLAEDLFRAADQQNLPGTTGEYPNWRRKLTYTIEDLQNKTVSQSFTSMFHQLLEESGRLPKRNNL